MKNSNTQYIFTCCPFWKWILLLQKFCRPLYFLQYREKLLAMNQRGTGEPLKPKRNWRGCGIWRFNSHDGWSCCDRILLNTRCHIKWWQFPSNKIMQAFSSNKEYHKSIFRSLKSVGKFCSITVNSKSNWKEFPPRQRVEFVDRSSCALKASFN